MPDGRVTSVPQDIVDKTARAWQEIYAKEPAITSACLRALEEVGWKPNPGRPSKQHPLRHITADALLASFKSMKDGGAPGMDHWRVTELEQWPPNALALLADFITRIEAGSLQWPQALLDLRVVLLPKPDAPLP
jgi:hypothetical protein